MTDPDRITLTAAAAYAGVSRPTIYRALRRGELVATTVYRPTLTFRRADLEAWLSARRIEDATAD